METKLYNYLAKPLLEKDIVFSSKEHQKKIENLKENSLGLDDLYLKKIIKYLKIYNSFLVSIGKQEVKLRYYQVLALYFTEMFFDNRDEKEFDDFSKNTLAYWMATGSGKTIVMHLNILQYLDKIKNYNILQVILTTPGVNLIDQHREEIGPFIEYLNKIKYNNKLDLIIDTTASLLNKGSDYYQLSGNKRFKRLVLVDEAHIGTSSSFEGKFYIFRNELNKENSFLFEYSATYHNLNKVLAKEYQNQIVYDYNYNLFYKDGYGKDFSFKQVGNDILAGDNENELKQNLDKCLFVINEKLDIWSNFADYSSNMQRSLWGDFKMFPNKPLITFMGNTVNSKDKERTKKKDGTVNWKEETSDIMSIVKYLADLQSEEKNKFDNVFNYSLNGKLTVTRNKSVEDELLLSYGDKGNYFGIINVGNGNKFFNDIEFKNVDKKTIEIINSKYLFKNIDKKESPINILIGSRKFAEGWNSFRVSVIALINLGSNAGNKIIQIFGRGVRLKGLSENGKRKYIEHEKDYFSLGTDNKDKFKKLETLNVLSVKKSYLEIFTKKIDEEIKHTYSFKIKVNPNIIKLNSGKELNFEEYKKKLPIFKLSKKEIYYKKVVLADSEVYYSYFDDGKVVENELISKFNFSLDYRVDRLNNGVNIKNELKNRVKEFKNYIDVNYIKEFINDYLEENKINLYSKKGGEKLDFDFNDVFGFIEEILYEKELGNDLKKIEKSLLVVISDFLKKLKNKINHRINSKNIVYDRELVQKNEDNPNGDFIEEYVVTKEFNTEQEKNEYIEIVEEKKREIIRELSLDCDKHIYFPLLFEEHSKNKKLDINISPDKLNIDEKIFVKQLSEHIDKKFQNPDQEFYLLRNVESLRSIGIYLENDEQPFFPDFILWIIDKEKETTYINFIDPKGQDGTRNRDSGKFNDKVKIGNKKCNKTLVEIEKKINKNAKNKVIINSFIFLKSGSELGEKDEEIQNKMLENNVFKMDWYGEELFKEKSYLDLFFEKNIKNKEKL